ncbi:MAG: putative manganese-dependent inorganic diphosphatase [Verrucomicrobiota bacterium]
MDENPGANLTEPVYVIGHKNPDTDSICSAIGYAELLRRTRRPEARAACCGGINSRTKWVLSQAGVPAPELVMDVRPTAARIARRAVGRVKPNETFQTAYGIMMEDGLRAIPVVDEQGRIIGMPSLHEILRLILPNGHLNQQVREVMTSLDNIANVLQAKKLVSFEPEKIEDFIMMVGASSAETFARRLGDYDASRLLVLTGDRPPLQVAAVEYGVRALVLTGGFPPEPWLAALAKDHGVSVLTCQQDTASTAQLVRFSRPVCDALLDSDFVSFSATELVSRILDQVQNSTEVLFAVVHQETRKLLGVFSKSDLLDPPAAQLVLVDHNEFSQAVDGADEADILEVLDHHRLSGNLVTREPVRFINELVGSTCTIVGQSFQREGLQPERGTAVCLAAGIIADTLKLTSPTTTEVDREMLHWLCGVGEIDLEDFARAFFETGSMLRELPASTALGADRKEYTESGWKLSISHIEELGLEVFWEREEPLRAALESLREEGGLDLVCVMVTDVGRHYSVLLAAGDERLLAKLPYPRMREGLYEMDGVVSRKKQLFPALSRAVSEVTEVVGAGEG